MQWLTLIYVFGFLSDSMHHRSEPFFESLWQAIKAEPTIPVILFFSLITCGFVTHLLGYHLIVIGYHGMSTYESKKDHFVKFAQGNPYANTAKGRCYLLCRRRVTQMYSLAEEEPIKVSDSDRRCSLKIVTKDRDIRKVLKYSMIEV
jgi:hypothetical protein